MNEPLPTWINIPTHQQKQTETYHRWRTLLRERLIRNPPNFLRHLSETDLRRILDATDHANGSISLEQAPFVCQLRAYERQFELIAWSYFSLMGVELRALEKKLSRDEFADVLHKIGLTLEEAQLALLVAEVHENNDAEL